MTINIDRENNKFRVKTQQFNTEWIPDTLENRKTTVVFLRLMEDENGKKLFTLQELAQITQGISPNTALKAIKQFDEKDRDFYKLHLHHNPKLNGREIEAITKIIKEDPLETSEEIARKIKKPVVELLAFFIAEEWY